MERDKELRTLDARHIWHPFTQAQTASDPILVREAKGAWVTAADSKRYLDLVSSWWVNLHGHAHPKIARAIAAQAETLEHVIFAGFTHAPAIELAKRITDHLPAALSRVFYSDNGSTAVEVALKMAYQYWRNRGDMRRKRFIAFEGGYHGDTTGAMSVGKSSGFYLPFEDLLFAVDVVPFPGTWEGDAEVEARETEALCALDAILERHPQAHAAAIIEPLVQGASGMRMCRPEFLRALDERLARANVISIFDEVMTGFGRTGAMFACVKAGATPDLLCLSKGITGGFLPLAATVCQDRIYDAFLGESIDAAFLHGHSYTANPLGCAAGLASLDIFDTEDTLKRISEIEAVHRERMRALSARPNLTRARVMGSIAAIELMADHSVYGSSSSQSLKANFMEQGLLLRPLGPVLYIMAPYCITDAELHRAYDVIETVVK